MNKNNKLEIISRVEIYPSIRRPFKNGRVEQSRPGIMAFGSGRLKIIDESGLVVDLPQEEILGFFEWLSTSCVIVTKDNQYWLMLGSSMSKDTEAKMLSALLLSFSGKLAEGATSVGMSAAALIPAASFINEFRRGEKSISEWKKILGAHGVKTTGSLKFLWKDLVLQLGFILMIIVASIGFIIVVAMVL